MQWSYYELVIKDPETRLESPAGINLQLKVSLSCASCELTILKKTGRPAGDIDVFLCLQNMIEFDKVSVTCTCSL